MAVTLSGINLTCRDFVLAACINPVSIALSSKTLIWSSSVLCRRPRDGDIPLVIPQPVRLASVYMVMSGFDKLLIW